MVETRAETTSSPQSKRAWVTRCNRPSSSGARTSTTVEVAEASLSTTTWGTIGRAAVGRRWPA